MYLERISNSFSESTPSFVSTKNASKTKLGTGKNVDLKSEVASSQTASQIYDKAIMTMHLHLKTHFHRTGSNWPSGKSTE